MCDSILVVTDHTFYFTYLLGKSVTSVKVKDSEISHPPQCLWLKSALFPLAKSLYNEHYFLKTK